MADYYKQRHHDQILATMRAAQDLCSELESGGHAMHWDVFDKARRLREAVSMTIAPGGATACARLMVTDSAKGDPHGHS